ncbi:MAG: hypothetical protein DYG94_00205 [Leptolyngbya sp. PLA3]|nr:MAG: hypothetical protein EDM82_01670 [Cyanobacteria bacterium CYA]MCE7967157.1 hypothetical protein [Leptolyngbya sp. PL-A3]
MAGGGWLITWEAPSYEVWRFDGTTAVQVDGASSIEFQVSGAGQVLSWRHIETLPEKRKGALFRHDLAEAVGVEQMIVPRFIDLSGKSRRPPTEGVLRLAKAEVVIDEPPGLFTRDGALARAAAAAVPLVEGFQRRFYWHDSPEAAAMEELPVRGSTGNPPRRSWSTAFITGGIIVLALGGFAWWRSRR